MLSKFENKENVTILGVVESVVEREAKNKNLYVQLTVTCEGKTARCFKWNCSLKDVGVKTKDIVEVVGEINVFGDNNSKSINANKIVVINEPSQELLKRILPSLSEEDQALYTNMLRDFVNQISDKFYKRLVNFVLKAYKNDFFKSPAAKINHDAYVGGLLKHTVAVTQVAVKIAEVYEGSIDKDLIIAGCILHDIGKVRGLNVELTGITYSTESVLLDHVFLGMEMIDAAIVDFRKSKVFDKEKLMLIKHIIASHHGQKDWGALNEPSTPEAMIVHLADMADCFVTMMQTALTDVTPGEPTEDKVWPMRRRLYRRMEKHDD